MFCSLHSVSSHCWGPFTCFIDLLCHCHFHQKICNSWQLNSHICLWVRDRLEACSLLFWVCFVALKTCSNKCSRTSALGSPSLNWVFCFVSLPRFLEMGLNFHINSLLPHWCRTCFRPRPDIRSGWWTRPTIQAGWIQCCTAGTLSYVARANRWW